MTSRRSGRTALPTSSICSRIWAGVVPAWNTRRLRRVAVRRTQEIDQSLGYLAGVARGHEAVPRPPVILGRRRRRPAVAVHLRGNCRHRRRSHPHPADEHTDPGASGFLVGGRDFGGTVSRDERIEQQADAERAGPPCRGWALGRAHHGHGSGAQRRHRRIAGQRTGGVASKSGNRDRGERRGTGCASRRTERPRARSRQPARRRRTRLPSARGTAAPSRRCPRPPDRRVEGGATWGTARPRCDRWRRAPTWPPATGSARSWETRRGAHWSSPRRSHSTRPAAPAPSTRPPRQPGPDRADTGAARPRRGPRVRSGRHHRRTRAQPDRSPIAKPCLTRSSSSRRRSSTSAR